MEGAAKEKVRESTRGHFFEALETYKAFAQELQAFDRKFFDFQIAFTGFLGVILTIVFSNKEDFSFCFPIAIIAIFISSFILLVYEIWYEGKKKMQNLNSWEHTLTLYNILNSAAQEDMDSYATQVIKILEQENKVIKAMREGRSVEEIADLINQKRKWNWEFFVWSLLALSVPILFLIELL